ncbi:flagellar filament capping protein FliD [Sphingosinicella soli]|uniref:Flagellar hook-associated protein 2 n=1 Tax=Sphingosinicella soli TaxID=333708 RepID=A0A7W7B479_9SPHN|nr:flagellar filament capping protein FliD [Sphingosinicella soli]MBB4632808.1 flagellar hook-associated protein 2 [Sphingosinicella soli]
MSILTSLGSGSGIDTTQLIADLVAAQRSGSDTKLTARQTAVDAKISSLSTISSALAAFSSALGSLVGSGALGRQVISSDTSSIALSLSGSSSPPSLSHTLEVTQLAQRQTVASAAVADRNAPIGEGTLTIDFGTLSGTFPTPAGFSAGTAAPLAITIGPENNSLVGLQQAINASNAGVTASIVEDASGARLVLRGETGAASAFTIDASAGLEAFEFGPGTAGMTWTAQAKNAVVVIDGLTVERPTNSISDLVSGLKLDLMKLTDGPVTLSSDYDAATLKTAVGNYVDVYNELVSMLATETRPATSGTEAGALASDRTTRDLKRMLADLSTRMLLTDGGGPSSLAEIGIKTNRDGTLSIDDAALTKAVTDHPGRVHDMFVPGQTSSSPLVEIASSLGAAKPGTYAVTDIVAATSGTLSGAAAASAFDVPVVIDATNKSFTVTLDGRTSLAISLPEGSYATGAALAAAFETAINDDSVLKSFGLSLSAAWDGSSFTFTSRGVGSTSGITLVGLDGTLAGTLGLDVPSAMAGTNVSGKIGGVDAIGIGNRLIAASSSSASGLAVNILGNATSSTIVVRSTVSGLISDIQKQLSAAGGGFTTASERLAKEAQSIAEEQERVEARSLALEDRLTIQFAAMERAIAAFNSTQEYMKQQIDLWTRDAG